MENNLNQYLGEEPVGRLMRKYAILFIISLLVGALYNIVDQIFIANADYPGSYGNAANTVVFPLTVIALAIAVMIGDGCCAFASLKLGRQEIKIAKKSVGNSVLYVRTGYESDHTCRWKSEVCDGIHFDGCCDQYHS